MEDIILIKDKGFKWIIAWRETPPKTSFTFGFVHLADNVVNTSYF